MAVGPKPSVKSCNTPRETMQYALHAQARIVAGAAYTMGSMLHATCRGQALHKDAQAGAHHIVDNVAVAVVVMEHPKVAQIVAVTLSVRQLALVAPLDTTRRALSSLERPASELGPVGTCPSVRAASPPSRLRQLRRLALRRRACALRFGAWTPACRGAWESVLPVGGTGSACRQSVAVLAAVTCRPTAGLPIMELLCPRVRTGRPRVRSPRCPAPGARP